jgi:16S rRNA processing protein RimM
MTEQAEGSPQTAAAWTVLAHLLRPQGRKGELLAELFTDFPERFEDRNQVFLAKPGFDGLPSAAASMTVVSHWLPVGRNHGRIVLGFKGVDSINLAEPLSGLDVLIPEEARAELDEDAEYISDLIGCIVFNHGVEVGAVTGVEFPATADGSRRLELAAPLLTVETSSGEEVLIPYVKTFLLSLEPANGRIEMSLPEGLLELNRNGGGE